MLAGLNHVERAHPPSLQDVGQRIAGVGVGGRHEREDVRPLLRPDIAEQEGGDGPIRWHDIAVGVVQFHPNVGVQLQVEWSHLIPQPIKLLREIVGRHVVLRAPHRARVREAELLRAFVRQLHESDVVLAHRRRDCVPALPDLA